MSHTVLQTDFDAWDASGTQLTLTAAVTATPNGVQTTNVVHSTGGAIPLVSRPSFALSSPVATPPNALNVGKHERFW
jgi:uncharacterized protein with beta-barrel porin domain